MHLALCYPYRCFQSNASFIMRVSSWKYLFSLYPPIFKKLKSNVWTGPGQAEGVLKVWGCRRSQLPDTLRCTSVEFPEVVTCRISCELRPVRAVGFSPALRRRPILCLLFTSKLHWFGSNIQRQINRQQYLTRSSNSLLHSRQLEVLHSIRIWRRDFYRVLP